MIRKLHNSAIDRQKWDALVQSSPYADVYALSSFLDVVCPDWSGLVLGDYEAIMPLPVKKNFFLTYLVQPIFSQQYRIYSQRNVSIQEVDLFRKEILKFRFVRICLSLSLFDSAIQRHNFSLDLSKPYEDLAQGYSENAKRNIHKAEKSVQHCRQVAVDEALDMFFAADTKRMYVPYEKQIRTLVTRCQSEAFAVCDDERPCAVAIFLKTQNRLYYLFPASTDEGKRISAMFLLIDTVIRNYAGTQFTLDFEGSEIEGVRRFYEGFGAVGTPYYFFQKNLLSKIKGFLK
ncbi:MAG: GNAT family N-acetyltransferase [Bacteroidales bacterium]|nr:GNAT family N-acetyltransferase [Bacteroidales bacterium]